VVASLVAWVLAAWAALHYGAGLGRWLAAPQAATATELFAGYMLCFLAVLLAVGLLGWALRLLVKSVGLSGVDRALGLAVGLVRGGFVACVIVLLLGFTTMPRQPAWTQSRLLPVLLPGARWLSAWLPEWAATRLRFDHPHSAPLAAHFAET
jgi:membrane protein required for colicin V production